MITVTFCALEERAAEYTSSVSVRTTASRPSAVLDAARRVRERQEAMKE